MNGLPVICPDFPEMRKLVKDYETGWLVDTDNAGDIYATIMSASSDRALLEKYRDNVRLLKSTLNCKDEIMKLPKLIELAKKD
jgi:glycosyltransferase involved in cell wall biosynthesis